MMYTELKIACEGFVNLKEHTMKIINFEKKKTKLLTKEHQESYEKTKIVTAVLNIQILKMI